jgi:CDP-glucose 4,6-dehydratase
MFWQGKKVFVTSPTSFLGSWVCLSLHHLGAQVFGFGEASAEPTTLFDVSNIAQKISMTYGDLRDERALSDALSFTQADVVLHLGEMGFLFDEDRKSPEVFAKSVVGTSQLLELLRETASVRSVVVASSDKVYTRPAAGASAETSAVAAYEILPTARLCAEFVALSYRHSFFNPEKYNKHKIAMATARVGAGLGGGDFSPRSFLFEAIDSVRGGQPMVLRHPHSQRSWIHVLDQVQGLLSLAEKLYERGPKLAATYNIGAADVATVGDVLAMVQGSWHGSGDFAPTSKVEARSLHGLIDNSLALQDLSWKPRLDVALSVKLSSDWFRAYFEGNIADETDRQLKYYFNLV